MIAAFQEGWMLDWLAKALTPGVVVTFAGIATLAWFGAMFHVRFRGMLATVAEIKASMITKADLENSVREMGDSLKLWADERFLGQSEFSLHRSEQDRIHARQNEDIKYSHEEIKYLNRRERSENHG